MGQGILRGRMGLGSKPGHNSLLTVGEPVAQTDPKRSMKSEPAPYTCAYLNCFTSADEPHHITYNPHVGVALTRKEQIIKNKIIWLCKYHHDCITLWNGLLRKLLGRKAHGNPWNRLTNKERLALHQVWINGQLPERPCRQLRKAVQTQRRLAIQTSVPTTVLETESGLKVVGYGSYSVV